MVGAHQASRIDEVRDATSWTIRDTNVKVLPYNCINLFNNRRGDLTVALGQISRRLNSPDILHSKGMLLSQISNGTGGKSVSIGGDEARKCAAHHIPKLHDLQVHIDHARQVCEV